MAASCPRFLKSRGRNSHAPTAHAAAQRLAMHCRTAGPGHAHPGGCRPNLGGGSGNATPPCKAAPARAAASTSAVAVAARAAAPAPHARRQPLRRRRPRHPGQLQQHPPGRRQPHPPHQRQQIPARSGHARLARRARPGGRAPLQQQLQPGLRAARPARPRLAAQLRGPPVRPPHQPADRAGRRHPHHLQQAARAPSLCASEQPGNGIVRIEGTDTKGTKETTPGQERHYTWQWMDGRELRFNHRGA